MRIVDILHEEEGEQQCSPSSNSNDSKSSRRRRWGRRWKKASSERSPRCLLSRWLSSKQFLQCRTCVAEYKDDEVEGEEEREEESREVRCVASLESAAAAEPLASAGKEELRASNLDAVASSRDGELPLAGPEEGKLSASEWKPEQRYLNIGMGAGFLFLLTRSITEFNKMTELRKEMEVLLKEIKDAIQTKDPSPSSGESKNNVTFYSSDSWADTEQSNNLSMQDSNPCLELVETPCDAESDSGSKYYKAYEDTKFPRIDEIEGELVSELELLQLNLGKQDSAVQLGDKFSGERSDPSESFSMSLGEHYEPREQVEEEDDTRDHDGVCPHELRRKLHELLETRQQERIAELESALKLARIKLREKEMEVCLWRDTAQLVSQNKVETLSR